MLLYRVGYHGNPGWFTTSADAIELGNFTCIGFFFISLVQIISTLLGDKSPVHVSICYNQCHKNKSPDCWDFPFDILSGIEFQWVRKSKKVQSKINQTKKKNLIP